MVSHDRAWLCEMATGQHVYQRPLARVHMLRELPELISAACGTGDTEGDSKMACLRFDEEDSEDMETPKKKPRLKKAPKARASVVAEALKCRPTQVPSSPVDRSSKTTVFALLDERGRVWLEVDALPWLVSYIRAEKEAGGVAPLQDDASAVAEANQSSRIYWNFRDDCWIARAQGVDGAWLQTSRGVKRRQKQSEHVNFQ